MGSKWSNRGQKLTTLLTSLSHESLDLKEPKSQPHSIHTMLRSQVIGQNVKGHAHFTRLKYFARVKQVTVKRSKLSSMTTVLLSIVPFQIHRKFEMLHYKKHGHSGVARRGAGVRYIIASHAILVSCPVNKANLLIKRMLLFFCRFIWMLSVHTANWPHQYGKLGYPTARVWFHMSNVCSNFLLFLHKAEVSLALPQSPHIHAQ